MSIDPSTWASWAEIITSAGVVIVAIWRWEKKLSSRLDKQDINIEQITKTLERQFGTNGFVLHEKVRALAANSDFERARLDTHLNQHIELGSLNDATN
jgi:hypothetical protein